jgi:Myb-like DNA-binding protein REB1
MSADCRDRHRNHIVNRELRVSGAWSPEEEEELTRIVTELTVDVGKDPDNDVFWGEVSKRMGNRRTRQQCRIKWTDALSKKLKNSGERPRWSQQDAYILVHKIASLQINDDSEIDWKLIADPDWNLWSAHQLQRRWQTLKKSVKDWDQLPFREIVEILKQKKAHPPSTSRHRHSNPAVMPKRAPLSEAMVPDEHLQDDEAVGIGSSHQDAHLDPLTGSHADVDLSGLPDFVEFGVGKNGEDDDDEDGVTAAAKELLNPAFAGSDSSDEDEDD